MSLFAVGPGESDSTNVVQDHCLQPEIGVESAPCLKVDVAEAPLQIEVDRDIRQDIGLEVHSVNDKEAPRRTANLNIGPVHLGTRQIAMQLYLRRETVTLRTVDLTNARNERKAD